MTIFNKPVFCCRVSDIKSLLETAALVTFWWSCSNFHFSESLERKKVFVIFTPLWERSHPLWNVPLGVSVPAEFLWESPGAGGWAHGAAVLREHPPQRRLAEARRGRHPTVSTAAQSAPRLSRRPRRLLQPPPPSLQRGPPSIIAASAPPQHRPERETRAYLQQASFL